MPATVWCAPLPQTFFHNFDPIHIYDGSLGTLGESTYGVDNIEIYHKDAFVNPDEALGHGQFAGLSHPKEIVHKGDHTNVVITNHQGDNQRTTIIEILPEYEKNRPKYLTVDEYVKRLEIMKPELKRLGYGELSDEKYKELILSGGFVHNGNHYVYNSTKESFIVHRASADHTDHSKKVVPLTASTKTKA